MIQQLVDHSRDGEDPAHNSAEAGEEVSERVPVFGQVYKNRRNIINEENTYRKQ